MMQTLEVLVIVMLGIIAGHDPHDPTTSRRRVPDYAATLEASVRGLRVGVPDIYYFDGVAPEVETGVREAARALEGLGTSLHAVTPPDPEILHGVANIIARAESAVVHARLARERPHELQPAVSVRCAEPGRWDAGGVTTVGVHRSVRKIRPPSYASPRCRRNQRLARTTSVGKPLEQQQQTQHRDVA